jgi:LemA protein
VNKLEEASMDLVLILIVSGVALAVVLGWSTYNRLMALDERCNTAFADVDVQLKHRHNLIPGLVETVRAFVGHEHAVLTEVTKARASALGAAGPEMRLEAETQVGQSINSLLTVVERYPDLQASSHFRDLRMELLDAENRITAARRFYNLAVDEFNATLRQFPGNMIGGTVRLGRRKAFDIGVERVLLDEPVAIRF